MPVLSNYHEFEGLHWETGTVRNHWAYRQIKAPHTGKPYTEALLMGISGGIVMAYFPFLYEGSDPQARILTRNTFDPLPRMLERMGVVQTVEQTGRPARARQNLLNALEEGIPPIVWAYAYTLPYNGSLMPFDEPMWWMFPIVVYGYDEVSNTAWFADRARVPLTATTQQLDAARARIKKDKFRLVTLDPPSESKLAAAVQMGIWDCIKLFTEAPPKGGKDSFGFNAYHRLAEVLTRPKHRLSWEKDFPPGRAMVSGLVWMFNDIMTFGKDGSAERDLYAAFLDEAAVILHKPTLKDVAQLFRASGEAWCELATLLLPDEVAPFKETRELILRRHHLFLEQGNAAIPEMQAINERLRELKAQVSADFPLDAAGAAAHRARIAEQVTRLSALEREAIGELQAAVS
jgi:hypothetical protein